jgi:hypothetical protein
MDRIYVNYKDFSVDFDRGARTFTFGLAGRGAFLRDGRIRNLCPSKGKTIEIAEFKTVSAQSEDILDGRRLRVLYAEGPPELPALTLEFDLFRDHIALNRTLPVDGEMHVEGNLFWGLEMARSTFACRLDRTAGDLRIGCGPAVSTIDNALFDRLTDSAVEIGGADGAGMSYSWEKQCFCFSFNMGNLANGQGLLFRTHGNYFQRKFSLPYRPVNGETQFKTPPVGWMTWYAVEFEASEAKVLENTEWIAKNLKKFGATCIWVDWEWYHLHCGTQGPYGGMDTFNPDKGRYPRGLKFVSDEIKRHGLVPALWIGATNDPNRNHMLTAHPAWILAEQAEWCGQWWIDPSHPEVIGTYIPAVFRQLLDWGYEAFKWDCFPDTLNILDSFHARFHDPGQSSEQALRNVVEAARKVIGNGRYMMSSSGKGGPRAITFAIDTFDGGRIGSDIFGWNEYVKNAVTPALKYLCFNNILFYADVDCVVLRKQFNTLEQAVSRASFNGLLGVPVTLGDHLPDLEPERVELLKRIMPVLDSHPMDLAAHEPAQAVDTVVVNLTVAKEFEQWNVVDVFNTTENVKSMTLDLVGNLHLDGEKKYLAFDFWDKKFLGECDRALRAELPAFSSKVFCVRRLVDHPQILSTSRHLSQGAIDLRRVNWDSEELILNAESEMVGDDPYEVFIYVPEKLTPVATSGSVQARLESLGQKVWKITFQPGKTGFYGWRVQFKA